MQRPDATCEPLKNFMKLHRGPGQAIRMEKVLEMASVGQQVGWGRVSGSH